MEARGPQEAAVKGQGAPALSSHDPITVAIFRLGRQYSWKLASVEKSC
jgi:hypothetical protein